MPSFEFGERCVASELHESAAVVDWNYVIGAAVENDYRSLKLRKDVISVEWILDQERREAVFPGERCDRAKGRLENHRRGRTGAGKLGDCGSSD